MAQRQDEVLREGVEQAEGQVVVVPMPVHWVLGHVAERVVHPPHVPLVAEAEAAGVDRPGYGGPGRGLLGDGHRAGDPAVDLGVHAVQQVDGFQVFVAAVLVGDPLAVLAAVVQVEHGGDGIDPESIHVEVVEPVQGAAEQEVGHLAPAVVVDQGVPVHVEALARIGMLVEVRAVEIGQPMLIRWEMAGHPVDQDADAVLVQHVDEMLKVLGRAEPAGRRIQGERLVAPGSIERVLVDRQQFDMGESHVLDVGREALGQFPIGQVAMVFLGNALPGPEMHLVDGHRAVPVVDRLPALHPFAIRPFMLGQPVDD